MFIDWSELQVFPAMKKTMQNSVSVLDRATYSTLLDDEYERRTASWNKTKLANATAE